MGLWRSSLRDRGKKHYSSTFTSPVFANKAWLTPPDSHWPDDGDEAATWRISTATGIIAHLRALTLVSAVETARTRPRRDVVPARSIWHDLVAPLAGRSARGPQNVRTDQLRWLCRAVPAIVVCWL